MQNGPGETKIRDGKGRFVPIPKAVPHARGAYIDKRLRRDLKWIARNFEIFVTEGFAGKLPSGRKVGCPKCHVTRSDHKIGLAVDIVPRSDAWRMLRTDPLGEALPLAGVRRRVQVRGSCDRGWRSVTRLAKWAEPRKDSPVPPFRWVGYDGDAHHGCGHHLHLSWTHASKYKRNRPSAWVMTFR